MQCQARGCDGCLVCRQTAAMQVPQDALEGRRAEVLAIACGGYALPLEGGGVLPPPGSFACEGAPTSDPAKINIEPGDPWARPGAETPRAAAETRTTVGFDPGAGAGPAPALNVNILALDLGTKTGYALRRRDGRMVHGTEEFTPRASWAPGQKWLRFRSWLSATITEHSITQIAFEDVKRHGPGQVLAAHAYGGFRAMLEMVADQHRVALVPFGVGQIKKHWTGSGVAKKDDMLMQAKVRGFAAVDDNNADALAILHLAIAKEKREWAAPPAKSKTRRTRKAGAVAHERTA